MEPSIAEKESKQASKLIYMPSPNYKHVVTCNGKSS
jgi:hypothetical protein